MDCAKAGRVFARPHTNEKMKDMSRKILVTGARGKTGREVAKLLAAQPDLTLLAGASQPEAAVDGAPVLPVRFDWADPTSWPDAVAGADAIYLMRPDLAEADTLIAALIALNPQAHIVLLSEQGADKLPDDDWVRRVELAVEGAAQSWTILRPSWFQQNFTDPRFFLDAIRTGRTVAMPSGGAAVAWVDTRDIAGVAVQALLDPAAHRGRHYTITGPDAVTIDGVAELLSVETGLAIAPVDVPIDAALQGLPAGKAHILGDLYRRVHAGDFAPVSDAVEAVLHRKPRALQQFVREYRGEWLA